MSMDIASLLPKEEEVYFAILDDYDVNLTGSKGSAIIQKTDDEEYYEVYDFQNKEISKPINYPIDALFKAFKIIGSLLEWHILGES